MLSLINYAYARMGSAPGPAYGSPWGSKQKHVKKVKSLIVIVLWGPYIGYIHQLLYMRLMYLSIECPTPYNPDKVHQMWVIAQ